MLLTACLVPSGSSTPVLCLENVPHCHTRSSLHTSLFSAVRELNTDLLEGNSRVLHPAIRFCNALFHISDKLELTQALLQSAVPEGEEEMPKNSRSGAENAPLLKIHLQPIWVHEYLQPGRLHFSHIAKCHRQTSETEEHSLITCLMAQHLKSVLERSWLQPRVPATPRGRPTS